VVRVVHARPTHRQPLENFQAIRRCKSIGDISFVWFSLIPGCRRVDSFLATAAASRMGWRIFINGNAVVSALTWATHWRQDNRQRAQYPFAPGSAGKLRQQSGKWRFQHDHRSITAATNGSRGLICGWAKSSLAGANWIAGRWARQASAKPPRC